MSLLGSGPGDARDQRLVEAFGVRQRRRMAEFGKLAEFGAWNGLGGRLA